MTWCCRGRSCARRPAITRVICPTTTRACRRLFIQSTDAEVLADDSAALLARAQAAEVDATLERWPGLWHDWQVFAGKVPEATQAVRHLTQFVAACLK